MRVTEQQLRTVIKSVLQEQNIKFSSDYAAGFDKYFNENPAGPDPAIAEKYKNNAGELQKTTQMLYDRHTALLRDWERAQNARLRGGYDESGSKDAAVTRAAAKYNAFTKQLEDLGLLEPGQYPAL